MSVIHDSQVGDDLVCIQEFNVSPEGEAFSWETSRLFRVGERVHYLGFLQDQHYKDHPGLGWMVRFDASDGKHYSATQTYFVTEECWRELKRFFAKRVLQEPRRPRTPRK